jgi:hypothetical protein
MSAGWRLPSPTAAGPLDQRVQIPAGLVAVQPAAGNVACRHLPLLLGSVVGGRFHRGFGCLDPALGRGQPCSRLDVVQHHQQLAGRYLVAGLHVDCLDDGCDRAVNLVVHQRLNAAIGVYRVGQFLVADLHFTY